MSRSERLLPVSPINDSQSALAFILGVLYNQKMRGHDAWLAPHKLANRLDGLSTRHILARSEVEFAEIFSDFPAIHPFVSRMAHYTYEIAKEIDVNYNGDARNIWTPIVTAHEFVQRLVTLPGIGEHKAQVALFVATQLLDIQVRADGGSYSIRECGGLAAIFYPIDEPVLVP